MESPEPLYLFLRAIIVGAGATIIMDLWGVVAARVFGFPPPNYGLVGRWIGHMPGGRFRHVSISQAPAIRGERIVGWTAHYAIGIAFAALLLGIYGPAWAVRPTLLPALITGWATLAAPFLVMQPGMGLGVAASRAPHPGQARLRSVLTHSCFGFGLYCAGLAARGLLSN